MHIVLLDSVDITARCIDSIRVNRKERVSGTAQFNYRPDTAPLLPTELVKKPVVIQEEGANLFTGFVERAVWNPGLRIYQVYCSNMLQEHFENLDETAILAAIPTSAYSKNIHGEREDGWQQAQACMETTIYDVFIDASGNLQNASWEAKGTADYTFTNVEVLNDGAYSLQLAQARDLITQFNIDYGYRYSRWKVRFHKWAWSLYDNTYQWAPDDFCDYLTGFGTAIPSMEMIHSAASGTGWDIVTNRSFLSSVENEIPGIAFELPPESGFYCEAEVGRPIGWLINDERRATHAFAASWKGMKRWAQTITEQYTITLNVDQMQPTLGIMPAEDSASLGIEVDDSSHEDSTSQDYELYGTDTIGDYFQDQDDEASRVLDLQVLIQQGVSKIWESFRKNSVTVEVALNPVLDLSHTVEVNTSDIQTKGKVRELTHLISDNRLSTTVKLAISQGGNIGSHAYPPAPDRPSTAPVHTVPYPSSTQLGTFTGGFCDSPPYDEETMLGFLADIREITCDPPAEKYGTKFQVKGKDIEDEARNEFQASQSATHNVYVPQDTLVLL